jgi:hypothetical protein
MPWGSLVRATEIILPVLAPYYLPVRFLLIVKLLVISGASLEFNPAIPPSGHCTNMDAI